MRLVKGVLNPPPGRRRIAVAFLYGMMCHSIFAAAVLSMMISMYFGMTRSFGSVAYPWAILANAALVLQFPLLHSLLLTRRFGRLLAYLAPAGYGGTLSTTTYAIIASVQLLALFVLWTPSGVIWWQAEGVIRHAITGAAVIAWLLLIKSIYDAGIELQSGALGWMSVAQDIKPEFPDMPTGGLFRIIRQPIYVSFAMTTWAVPTWTPDQLALAITLTAYCLIAPKFKERRLAQRHGERFETYKARVPYVVPGLKGKTHG